MPRQVSTFVHGRVERPEVFRLSVRRNAFEPGDHAVSNDGRAFRVVSVSGAGDRDEIVVRRMDPVVPVRLALHFRPFKEGSSAPQP